MDGWICTQHSRGLAQREDAEEAIRSTEEGSKRFVPREILDDDDDVVFNSLLE